MRSFRFPVWMIGMMLTALVAVVIAIEKSRVVSIQLSSAVSDVPAGWWSLPGAFMVTVGLTGVIALLGLAVRRLLHSQGTD